MSTDLTINEMPWDYDEFVSLGIIKYRQWNSITLELGRLLYRANIELTNSGYRTDQPCAKMAQGSTEPQTFKDFLEAVGIPRRTGYNWLALYDAEADRLLTPEELKIRQQKMLEDLFNQIEEKGGHQQTWRPEPWTPSLEKKYRSWLKARAIINKMEEEEAKQAWLFSQENLLLTVQQLHDDPSPEEILYHHELCNRYRTVVAPVVPVEQQISIVRIVEKSLELFEPASRPAIARSIARVIVDLTDKEEQ